MFCLCYQAFLITLSWIIHSGDRSQYQDSLKMTEAHERMLVADGPHVGMQIQYSSLDSGEICTIQTPEIFYLYVKRFPVRSVMILAQVCSLILPPLIPSSLPEG